MSRLEFYRGPALEPEPWCERWPCAAVIISVLLLAFALAGLLGLCLLLDRVSG